VSIALNLARGDTFMTVFSPTVTFTIGALRKPARDRHHDPCYKLMATFHKMKDESGTEIVRCFGKGHAGHVSKQGSRISARRVALALFAVVVLLLVLILEAASVWTSVASALSAPGRWGRAPAGAVFGDAARRGRRVRAPGAAAAHILSKWQDLTPGAMPHRHDGVGRQAPSRQACESGGHAARPSGHPPQVQ
jgi:hypothetical protein